MYRVNPSEVFIGHSHQSQQLWAMSLMWEEKEATAFNAVYRYLVVNWSKVRFSPVCTSGLLCDDMCLLQSDGKGMIALSCNTALPRDTITWLLFQQSPGKYFPFHPVHLGLWLIDMLWGHLSNLPIPLAKLSYSTTATQHTLVILDVILRCMTHPCENHPHSFHLNCG